MENKKNLATIALSALILAASIPLSADAGIEAHGIILASGCASDGCSAKQDSGASTQANHDWQKGSMTQRADEKKTLNLTEAQLLAMLNPQGKAIYLGLNPEGKALAIELASKETYRDKNLAIKEAQRRINERHGLKH
ncbi:MAG: hypothetical protein ACH350_03965 [Parachlamydiaceae bacterium]